MAMILMQICSGVTFQVPRNLSEYELVTFVAVFYFKFKF